MLDTSTNDLGHCFISLWSKYLLDGNYDDIRCKIIKLAELGEVHAIQVYYLYEETHNNRKIANKVLEKKGEFVSKNHKWAFAKYCYYKSKVDINEIVKDIENRKKFWSNASASYYTFVQYFKEAIKNPGLHYFEYLSTYPSELLKYTNANFDINSEENILRLKEDRKYALRVYRDYPNNDRARFAVAKHLYLFGTSSKDKKFAAKILEELASRNINIDKIIKNNKKR